MCRFFLSASANFTSSSQHYETQQKRFRKNNFIIYILWVFVYNELNIIKESRDVIIIATLDDIARELGISKSTVSKALSGAKDVSKAMRQTVLEKAVEMGYSRSIRKTAAPRIAIFIMNMQYKKPEDFGYDIVCGFRKAAEPAGYQVEVVDLDQKTQLQTRYDEYMVYENYSGGLFLGMTLLDPWLKEFQTCRTPTVLYDNRVNGNPNVTSMGVDNVEALKTGVQYLKSLGHTRIGYLSSALEAYCFQQRYQAFFQAMAECGLEACPEMAGNSLHISQCLADHLPRLLKKGCTAIMCSHDILAHSAVIFCAERGLRVPEDISVMGFDDIPLSRFTSPPLTTIRQNRSALGKSAFYAMSSLLNKVAISSLYLHPELVIRSSCGPLPENINLYKLFTET